MNAGATMVIGSEGNVGARLVIALRAARVAIVTASRRGSPADCKLDITDRDSVRSVIAEVRPATVIHLAATSSVDTGPGADVRHASVNVDGFRNVCDAAGAIGCRRLVLASSTSVYGQTSRGPVAESDTLAPDSPYARSKLMAERICVERSQLGMNTVVLRFPPLYGSGWLRNIRVRVCLPATAGRATIALLGEEPEYSMCAIENAVASIQFAAAGKLATGAYNVADAVPYAHSELRRVLRAVDGMGIVLPMPVVAVRALTRVLRLVDRGAVSAKLTKVIDGAVFDTSKIAGQGFTPTHVLSDLLPRKTQ